jgi:hypothetical protein
VIGAIGRTRCDGTGHRPRPRPTLRRVLMRVISGGVGLQGRLILQVGGGRRATCGKPFLASIAVPRWQPQSSDSRGNGGTHEAWQAASNRLISNDNQVYDDFQSSSYVCLTVTYFHPSLSSSLAAHEGQTPEYRHLSDHAETSADSGQQGHLSCRVTRP